MPGIPKPRDRDAQPPDTRFASAFVRVIGDVVQIIHVLRCGRIVSVVKNKESTSELLVRRDFTHYSSPITAFISARVQRFVRQQVDERKGRDLTPLVRFPIILMSNWRYRFDGPNGFNWFNGFYGFDCWDLWDFREPAGFLS
jgi:hypothetical protein